MGYIYTRTIHTDEFNVFFFTSSIHEYTIAHRVMVNKYRCDYLHQTKQHKQQKICQASDIYKYIDLIL